MASPPKTGIALYNTEDGQVHLDVRLQDENLWLNQRQMADLFDRSVKTINEHLQNIYEEGELAPEATIRKFRIVQREGMRDVERLMDHYNLDAILAVGFRVRSNRGTQFRQWATNTLKEYIIKGFVMDDQRLKEGRNIGADYFDELLERIRDIRASERRFYQKITDIYATAADYNAKAPVSREFFATVQNKLHWAIHGHTAAELIKNRADASEPNMGLQSWKGQRVRKGDITVAKNYLSEEELSNLNRIVTMYLDFAEDQAKRHKEMTMQQWADRLDAFLEFNDRDVLDNPGKVSKTIAEKLASEQYEKFEERRREALDQEESDFDRFVEQTKKLDEK
ncbi:virulence RhuM family protein [Pseudomonadota bacterium]